jgi:hypothetical protein
LVLFDKSQLSPSVGDNLLENIREILIQTDKVLLKSLLLLVVHVMQKLQDAFLCLNLLLKLFHQLFVLVGILIVPLHAMSILSWHLIHFKGLLLNFFSECLDCLPLDSLLIKNLVICFNFSDKEIKFIIPGLELINLHAEIRDFKDLLSEICN